MDSELKKDIISNYRKTIFQTTIWQGLVLFIYAIIIAVQWHDFISLQDENKDCYYFILVNIYLYVFGIGYNIVALILARYYKFFIKGAYIFQMALVAFTIYGLTLVNQMFALQEKNK